MTSPTIPKGGFILLMTACIAPDINSVKRSDPTTRLNDYKTSLLYWLNYDEQRITGIVFIENSSYDLVELKHVVDKNNKYRRDVEFLSITPTEIPPGLHYGYSELEMIDHAFDHSALLIKAEYIVKVTGRLYFPRLARLIDEVLVKKYDVIADSRDFDFFKLKKHYVLTTLFIVQKDFYMEVLYNSKRKMSPHLHHMELVYFNILKPLAKIKNKTVQIRFPFNVEPTGIGAHWGVDYKSKKKRFESYLRALFRFILPFFKV
ncbi:hypothetical protein [Segetibacter aerophilus]|uniref:Uncharacterized protein n=1 Tax=Segetibacter aerophilus TaxID=670293 RepID=A0A512BEQ0_9BACT|nr:hypothetical protein [Segetibacter aerophilus]GEO10449.1 hypothetical protein SAE01_29450 [Segetibacter aerophilus]